MAQQVPDPSQRPTSRVDAVARLVKAKHRNSKVDRECGDDSFRPAKAVGDDGRDLVYCEACGAILWRQGETANVGHQFESAS